jgi:DNA polymerase I
MSHRKPNTANIPNEFDNNGKVKLLGAQMRKLWVAPKNRLLVGVDAEAIQLRIFAHYDQDPGLIEALVNGKKSDKTDPHSYNQRVLGNVCKTRQAAKRFLYALFLGAGIDKLASILECSRAEVEGALERLLSQYPGFEEMRSSRFPSDAKRGWFTAIDGRPVKIPGESEGTRRHLAMSGYLQSGEAIVMKRATLLWTKKLEDLGIDYKLVDLVHDEWQTETMNNIEVAMKIAETQADSLREVGEIYKLNCPLAGSYWNDDLNDYTIGTNWKVTH